MVAGWDKELLEFGARRAQGPDGAMSASRYSYLGMTESEYFIIYLHQVDSMGHRMLEQAIFLVSPSKELIPMHLYRLLTVSTICLISLLQTAVVDKICCLSGLSELVSRGLTNGNVSCEDFVSVVLAYRERICQELWPNLNSEGLLKEGELTAFVAYAQAFPRSFLCLVDTYETLSCGTYYVMSVPRILFYISRCT